MKRVKNEEKAIKTRKVVEFNRKQPQMIIYRFKYASISIEKDVKCKCEYEFGALTSSCPLFCSWIFSFCVKNVMKHRNSLFFLLFQQLGEVVWESFFLFDWANHEPYNTNIPKHNRKQPSISMNMGEPQQSKDKICVFFASLWMSFVAVFRLQYKFLMFFFSLSQSNIFRNYIFNADKLSAVHIHGIQCTNIKQ